MRSLNEKALYPAEYKAFELVGTTRIELVTPTMSTERSLRKMAENRAF